MKTELSQSENRVTLKIQGKGNREIDNMEITIVKFSGGGYSVLLPKDVSVSWLNKGEDPLSKVWADYYKVKELEIAWDKITSYASWKHSQALNDYVKHYITLDLFLHKVLANI